MTKVVKRNSSIIIKLDNMNEMIVGENKKIVGLMKGKYIIPIIDSLNLEANPRASKTGGTTDAIQETLEKSPMLFPFKSKGILLASSRYEMLDRGRIKISPQNLSVEGILDGGHNTLAIGLFILNKAFAFAEKSMSKGSKTWDQFKEIWNSNRMIIKEYLEAIQNKRIDDDLNFYIPTELLVPVDPEDIACLNGFTSNLLEICDARNNNAELQLSAKANQKGYFDTLKVFMDNHNKTIGDRIEWKTNDGGDIKVADLVALSWIPLSLITPVHDLNGREIEPVAPNLIYSGKGSCLKQFDRLMSSEEVTTKEDGNDYRSILHNGEVESALKIAVEFTEIYDYIYEMFPSCYNQAGGTYGRITSVKKLNEKRKIKQTPFSGKEIDTVSPDGFIAPLVYGMQSLLENRVINGKRQIVWKQAPMPFLFNNFQKIVDDYFGLITLCDYDPQKVGKAAQSYQQVLRTVQMELLMNTKE